MENKYLKIKAYIQLMRPFTLLPPAFCFFGAGVIAWSIPPKVNFSEIIAFLILGSASVALLNAGSNSLNQYYDIKIDAINKPERPLPSGKLSKKEAFVCSLILYFIALSLGWFVAPSGSHQFLIMLTLAVLFTVIYSVPPIRTKRFLFLSNLTIALPRGFVIVAGWSAVKNMFQVEPWAIGFIFFLFILGAASTKDFSDIIGDAKYNCITLPVKYGVKKSADIIAPFFIFPWIILIPFSYFKIINANFLIVSILSLFLIAWGFYLGWLVLRNPEKLATEKNHVSWRHMYLLLIFAYLGITLAYLLN